MADIAASVTQQTINATIAQQSLAVTTVQGPAGPTGNPATKQIGFSVRNPAVGFVLGMRLAEALTVTEVSVATDIGTVTLNVEKRTLPNGAGADLLAADAVALNTGTKLTTLQNAAWVDDEWVGIDISATSGSPTLLVVTITASAT